MTVVKGAHTLKAGFGFQQNLDTQAADIYTQYVFPSIAAYQSALSGVNPLCLLPPSTRASATPGAWYHSFFWDGFMQDSWQVTPKLLVVGGVRYDRFSGPGERSERFAVPYSQHFRTPSGNFAPRLGIAWSIDSKTVVRVNSGIFYEAPPTNLWYNALYQDGGSSFLYGVHRRRTPPALRRFRRLSVNGTLPRASSTHLYDLAELQERLCDQFELQITRQLSANDALTVGYANTGGRNLEFLRNINLINPTGFSGGWTPGVLCRRSAPTTRLDPRFNNIALQDTGANSSYNALIVNYLHRMSEGLTVNASYTWSHSISDAPEANAYDQGSLFIEDPTNRESGPRQHLDQPAQLIYAEFCLDAGKQGNQ